MNIMFIIITIMFLIIGVVTLFFKDKDNKHKDIIIPVQGTKFRGNI